MRSGGRRDGGGGRGRGRGRGRSSRGRRSVCSACARDGIYGGGGAGRDREICGEYMYWGMYSACTVLTYVYGYLCRFSGSSARSFRLPKTSRSAGRQLLANVM